MDERVTFVKDVVGSLSLMIILLGVDTATVRAMKLAMEECVRSVRVLVLYLP
jgi:hypothetical protein